MTKIWSRRLLAALLGIFASLSSVASGMAVLLGKAKAPGHCAGVCHCSHHCPPKPASCGGGHGHEKSGTPDGFQLRECGDDEPQGVPAPRPFLLPEAASSLGQQGSESLSLSSALAPAFWIEEPASPPPRLSRA